MQSAQIRLTQSVLEVERHAARRGWDQAPRLYALVGTGELLEAEPDLAATMGLDAAAVDPSSFTPVEQDDLPTDRPLDEVLAHIAWPEGVSGCALVLERLMLPPGVDEDVPDEESEVTSWVAEHPDRQDVRLAVAVLRDGARQAAVRLRSHDEDDAVLSGPDLVPGLADALVATLE